MNEKKWWAFKKLTTTTTTHREKSIITWNVEQTKRGIHRNWTAEMVREWQRLLSWQWNEHRHFQNFWIKYETFLNWVFVFAFVKLPNRIGNVSECLLVFVKLGNLQNENAHKCCSELQMLLSYDASLFVAGILIKVPFFSSSVREKEMNGIEWSISVLAVCLLSRYSGSPLHKLRCWASVMRITMVTWSTV